MRPRNLCHLLGHRRGPVCSRCGADAAMGAGVRAKSEPTPDSCTCDWLDIGPRCDFCVAICSRDGHPYTENLTNGQHHRCGVIL